jgi:hypothetical protein
VVANGIRTGGNESETKELRRQVDSLVELLGHHGVRLDTRSSNGPLRGSMDSIPPPQFETPVPIFQKNITSSYPPPHVSMAQPPIPVPNEAATYEDPNQYLQNPIDGGPWSRPPNDPLPDGYNKHPEASPSNEPSHGTLVISASGRSKYLGPSAASEWLKDVS